MKKVFLDTNILLDLLASRSPFDIAARQIFDWAEQEQLELYASALSFCNIAYILKKLQKDANINEILSNLAATVNITVINSNIVQKALQSSFNDFEDALQHFSALTIGNDIIIITRNISDFTNSTVRVMTSDNFVATFNV